MAEGEHRVADQRTHRQQGRVDVHGSARFLADQVGTRMRRIILAISLAAIGIATAIAQQPGTSPQFTGTSTPMDGKDLSAARRSFEAGARSYWHSHDNGQLLFVEKGIMRTAKR